MPQSETIGALAAALAKAQSAIRNATRDKENPFFKSKYADLASVWEACREPLTTNGLAIVQTTHCVDPTIQVVTTLIHSSGEWISGELSVKPSKADAQSIGSALTYLRRYGLAAIAGVATEDDDGNAAVSSGNGAQSRPQTTAAQKPVDEGYKGPTNEQAARIFAIGTDRATALGMTGKRAGEGIVRQVYESLGIEHTCDITPENYDVVCAAVAAWGNGDKK